MSTAASADRSGPKPPPRWRGATVALVLGLSASSCLLAAGTLGTAPAAAAGPEITGAGSSYAAVAISQWVAQIAALNGDDVSYSVSSSVIGLNLFARGQVNFGASEIGYSTGQMSSTPTEPYQYLPDVAGATCLMFNVTNRLGAQAKTLNLSNQVLAGIWTGTITNWDAPQIAALNPGALLPDAPIIAVFRTDASGENYLFSQYLDYVEPSIWAPFVRQLEGSAPAVGATWPQGTNHGRYNLSNFDGESGSDVASDFVASTNDSITYVETAYAILHGDPCAYIRNASGNWVAPSEETDAVGLEKAELLPDLEQKLQGVYTNPIPDAYPISAYSYIVTPKGPGSMPPAQGAVLGQFIRFFACEGQNAAGALGYSPLPPNLVDADFAAIDRIPGAARAPAAATAANCDDPYVDGQTVLPGEPCIIGHPCPGNGGGGGGGGSAQSGGSGGGPGGGGGRGAPGRSGDGTGTTGRGSSRQVTSTTAPGGRQHFGGSGGAASAQGSGNLSLANGLWPGKKIIPGAKPGGSLPNGRILGYQLATEDFSLMGVRVSPATMWVSVLLLLLLVTLPPTAARWRRRRRSRPELSPERGEPT